MTTELEFAKRFLNALDSRPIQVPADWMADLKTLQPPIPYILPRMPKPMQKPAATPPAESSSSSSTGLTIVLRSTRNPPLDLRIPSQDPNTTSILSLKQSVSSELGLPGTEKIRILFRKKPCSDAKTIKELLAAASGDGGDGASGAAEQGEVEFGVMVIGGMPIGVAPTAATASASASASAKWDADGDTDMGGSPASPPVAAAAAAAVAATATTAQKEAVSIKGQTAHSPVPAIGASGREVLDNDKGFWADLEGFLQQRVKDADVAAQARRLFEAAWKEGSK